MAHVDPILSAAPAARVAGPHQSTVTTILRAVDSVPPRSVGSHRTLSSLSRLDSPMSTVAVSSKGSVIGGRSPVPYCHHRPDTAPGHPELRPHEEMTP